MAWSLRLCILAVLAASICTAETCVSRSTSRSKAFRACRLLGEALPAYATLKKDYLAKLSRVRPAPSLFRRFVSGASITGPVDLQLKPVEGDHGKVTKFLTNSAGLGMATVVTPLLQCPSDCSGCLARRLAGNLKGHIKCMVGKYWANQARCEEKSGVWCPVANKKVAQQAAYVIQTSSPSGTAGQRTTRGTYLSRVILSTGALSNAAGSAGYDCVDGTGEEAQLGQIEAGTGALVMAPDGKSIYVLAYCARWGTQKLEETNQTKLEVYGVHLRQIDITVHPARVTTLHKYNSRLLSSTSIDPFAPFDQIILDSAGKTLYGVQGCCGISMIKLDKAGNYSMIKLAGTNNRGYVDSPGPSGGAMNKIARFSTPVSLALTLDEKGLVIADGYSPHRQSNNAIRYLDIATRSVTTIAGGGEHAYGSRDGTGSEAKLNSPSRILRIEGSDRFIFYERGTSLLRELYIAETVQNNEKKETEVIKLPQELLQHGKEAGNSNNANKAERSKKWRVRTLAPIPAVGDQGVIDLSLIKPTEMLVTETQSLAVVALTQKVRCQRWMTQDLKWLLVPNSLLKRKWDSSERRWKDGVAHATRNGVAVYSLSNSTGVSLADGSRWGVKALRKTQLSVAKTAIEKTVVCLEQCTPEHVHNCTVDTVTPSECCVAKLASDYTHMDTSSIAADFKRLQSMFEAFDPSNPDIEISGQANQMSMKDRTALL